MQNSTNAPQQGQVVDMPTEEVVERDIYLEGIESYKDIVTKLKAKVVPLVQEGTMSQNVASRIIDDFSYEAFQKSVKVNYQ